MAQRAAQRTAKRTAKVAIGEIPEAKLRLQQWWQAVVEAEMCWAFDMPELELEAAHLTSRAWCPPLVLVAGSNT